MKKLLFITFAILNYISQPIQANESELYGLFSYGLGDNPANAKNNFFQLMPEQCKLYNCFVPTFSQDSLKSSIFNSDSYVLDLIQIYQQSLINKNFIAIGHSRGAEMLIHFVASCNPATLQALILLAAPVSVGSVVKGKFTGSPSSVPKKTLDSIKKIKNKSLPIILFHQQNDTVVTIAHSQCLLKAFYDYGFTNVFLCVMNSGGHNNIMDNDAFKTLRKFYQNNNLVSA